MLVAPQMLEITEPTARRRVEITAQGAYVNKVRIEADTGLLLECNSSIVDQPLPRTSTCLLDGLQPETTQQIWISVDDQQMNQNDTMKIVHVFYDGREETISVRLGQLTGSDPADASDKAGDYAGWVSLEWAGVSHTDQTSEGGPASETIRLPINAVLTHVDNSSDLLIDIEDPMHWFSPNASLIGVLSPSSQHSPALYDFTSDIGWYFKHDSAAKNSFKYLVASAETQSEQPLEFVENILRGTLATKVNVSERILLSVHLELTRTGEVSQYYAPSNHSPYVPIENSNEVWDWQDAIELTLGKGASETQIQTLNAQWLASNPYNSIYQCEQFNVVSCYNGTAGNSCAAANSCIRPLSCYRSDGKPCTVACYPNIENRDPAFLSPNFASRAKDCEQRYLCYQPILPGASYNVSSSPFSSTMASDSKDLTCAGQNSPWTVSAVGLLAQLRCHPII